MPNNASASSRKGKNPAINQADDSNLIEMFEKVRLSDDTIAALNTKVKE